MLLIRGPIAQLVSSTWLIIRGSLVQAQVGPQKNHPSCWMIFCFLWKWRDFFVIHQSADGILTILCLLFALSNELGFANFAKACGDSGIRTRVQTRNQYAFYTLILAFIFEQWQDPSHQPLPYLLWSHFCIAAYRNQPWYFRTAWSYQPLGVGLERCLGSAPCAETRRIYYTSITQRELQYCCQL